MTKTINISDELWSYLNSQRRPDCHKFEDIIWNFIKEEEQNDKKDNK